MSWKLKTAALLMVSVVSACGGIPQVTRGTAFSDPVQAGVPMVQPDYNVQDLTIGFEPGLRVSEANSYYPIADIVWRGDSFGDRFEQISAIARGAMEPVTGGMKGANPVTVDVMFTRFHSLTEKTRYSVGGTHSIRFVLTVRDARSGVVVDGPRRVDASFPAFGGSAALAAEQRGETQKVRVSARLAEVIAQELSRPMPAVAAR